MTTVRVFLAGGAICGVLFGCGGAAGKTVTIPARKLVRAVELQHPGAEGVRCKPQRVVQGSGGYANVPEPSCRWTEDGKRRTLGP